MDKNHGFCFGRHPNNQTIFKQMKREEKGNMKRGSQYNKTMGLRAGGLGFFFFILILS